MSVELLAETASIVDVAARSSSEENTCGLHNSNPRFQHLILCDTDPFFGGFVVEEIGALVGVGVDVTVGQSAAVEAVHSDQISMRSRSRDEEGRTDTGLTIHVQQTREDHHTSSHQPHVGSAKTTITLEIIIYQGVDSIFGRHLGCYAMT
jgi:hypothetical protein